MRENLIYRASEKTEAFRQGEILTGVLQLQPLVDESSQSLENLAYKSVKHPYAIILSQDCDLDWDYTARQTQGKQNKFLNSILFCEIYEAREVRYDKDIHQMNSEKWNQVKTNCNKQYHFFEKVPAQSDLFQQGLPELTADFKKIFAVEATFLYYLIKTNKAQRRTVLVSPYLEDFSQRYCSYLGRVALPAQHESEKAG